MGAHKLRKVYIKIKNKAGMERGSFAPFPKIRKGVFFFFWGGGTTGGACRWFQKRYTANGKDDGII